MRENYLIWFSTISILGILFILWGALAPSMPLIPGDIWLIVPGTVMLILGLAGIFENIIFENRIKKCLKQIPPEGINLSDLADKMNFEEFNLRALIVSLRTEGKLQVYFDSQNGLLIPSNNFDATCKICGAIVDSNPFCTVCGNKNQ